VYRKRRSYEVARHELTYDALKGCQACQNRQICCGIRGPPLEMSVAAAVEG